MKEDDYSPIDASAPQLSRYGPSQDLTGITILVPAELIAITTILNMRDAPCDMANVLERVYVGDLQLAGLVWLDRRVHAGL